MLKVDELWTPLLPTVDDAVAASSRVSPYAAVEDVAVDDGRAGRRGEEADQRWLFRSTSGLTGACLEWMYQSTPSGFSLRSFVPVVAYDPALSIFRPHYPPAQ